MKNIIFIAPPAAGKGTQSKMLAQEYGYIHISTGDILREEIANKTKLGILAKSIIDDGKLLPDNIMIDIIKNKLSRIKGKPFILDGFPRTLNQANILSNLLDSNYAVIYLSLDEEIAKKRIIGRITCTNCGKSYNTLIKELNPNESGICDKCGNILEKRKDDNEISFETRYKEYVKNTSVLLDYYLATGNLYIVDANKDRIDIYEDITRIIGGKVKKHD